MEKILDLKKTVAELVEENPEVSEIMAGIGFKEMRSRGRGVFGTSSNDCRAARISTPSVRTSCRSSVTLTHRRS